ncbi:MAG: hypothetical protein IH988_08405 [Planctomycetes bacterium]|nr:hypothetical protein [Planctomycetota bacterium]
MGQSLAEADPEIAKFITQEARRQALSLELIASENFVSDPILEAAGTVLTNKYAEGYPGRRYYGGCEYVDGVEALAISANSLNSAAFEERTTLSAPADRSAATARLSATTATVFRPPGGIAE